MAGAPIVMLRKGDHKFIYCETDPAQLYDLSVDPAELSNLAKLPEHAGLVSEFVAEIERTWDLPALRDQVISSQKQRQSVHKAMNTGDAVSWDWDPAYNAANKYVRNNSDWTEAAERFRFPRPSSG